MTEDFRPAARVIADSISPAGDRLTSIEAKLHRFVLAELNTHCAFARNSASSRAIPVTRTLTTLAETPAVPVRWPQAQKGMQGGPEIEDPAKAREIWLAARDDAVARAEQLLDLGVHKSVVNRLLEPFLPHTVLITATEWDGFFEQRCSPLAQPEMEVAANLIRAAYRASTPTEVPVGEWHLPFLDALDREQIPRMHWRPISVARCARVSYNTHDGRRDFDADWNLFTRLVEADPPHMSPFEHVATPDVNNPPGKFAGWRQLRHITFGR